MTIRDLHPEHEREFASSALEVLVDQAMAEYPDDFGVDRVRLHLAHAFASLPTGLRIEWAAQISSDILTFEEYQTLHIGD